MTKFPPHRYHATMQISAHFGDYPATLAKALQRAVSDPNDVSAADPALVGKVRRLSSRERGLLQLLLLGLPVRLIAYQLGVKCKTAQSYSYALMRKLGMPDRATLSRIGRSCAARLDHDQPQWSHE